jgi:hypothetical protein
LARVPKWVWVAFFVGALIPILVILGMAIFAGLLAVLAVLIVSMVVRFIYRLLHRRPRPRAGEIVVSAVRVVDP